MGVDLGLNCIAVAAVGTRALFFSGAEAGFVRERFHHRRRRLGKAKKLNAIRKSQDKEARWMKNRDHWISRRIVDFALRNGVTVIRLEDLKQIRKAITNRSMRRKLHSWSFGRLRDFIEYKAALAGIRVERVRPEYTSQTCKCGHRSKKNRKGIHFHCEKCGYRSHADLNAAINISKAA